MGQEFRWIPAINAGAFFQFAWIVCAAGTVLSFVPFMKLRGARQQIDVVGLVVSLCLGLQGTMQYALIATLP